VTASTLIVLVLTAVTAIMTMAGGLEQRVTLQTDADQDAVKAMGRMILEIREAKSVEIIEPWRFRVYYPVTTAEGHYDRYSTDWVNYLEYSQRTPNGQSSGTGSEVWKSTPAGKDRILTTNVAKLRVAYNSANSIRLTLEVKKTSGQYTGLTQLTERVLYLRNN
jgi:hypothetical protein